MIKKIYWGSYTTNELEELIKSDPVLLLPVGAYEQHGPHLTLNTDTDIGLKISKATVKKVGVPCALLPPIWLGISEHHMNFKGSLTLKQSTLTNLVYDILESLHRHQINKVLIVNSHGGNIAPLSAAISLTGANMSGKHVLVTYWDLIADVIKEIRKSGIGGMSHGGEFETSLKLFLSPNDVRKEKIISNIVEGNDYWSPEMFKSNKVAMYKSFDELSEYGHIGDPTRSTKEMGSIAFKEVVNRMVELVQTIYKGEL